MPTYTGVTTEQIVFASAATVPTSWTAVYTAPPGKRAIIHWASFYATDTQAYLVKARITTGAGVSIIVGQGQPTTAGYIWKLVDNEQVLVLDPKSSLDLIGSGTTTIAVNYYICGVLTGVPA